MNNALRTPLLMTPGPTQIHEEVRQAMAREITNPDLDPAFYELYKETTAYLQRLFNTQNEVLIFSGEGILGLEAACASLIEPGDKVLCIENGIFGKGFGDFAKMYGAEVTYFTSDYRRAIDTAALEKFLQENHDFKIATLVHCETPSGITNPVDALCPLLNRHGILTVVDSVSAVGGEPIMADQWKMDLVLCGSQKCLSAPPGLTFFSISPAAWHKIDNRKTPVAGFYTNIGNWKTWYQDKWFPYTQPISDIYALNAAAKRLLAEEDPIWRHSTIAHAVRTSITAAGLALYPLGGYANTVSTIQIPTGITFGQIFDSMLQDHNIMIAGAFDFLKDKVFRIGHMGENCREDKVLATLKALDQVLRKHGVDLEKSLDATFGEVMKQSIK